MKERNLMTKPFMSSNEVAALCKVSHDTVGKWIRRGRLPRAIKSGCEYRHEIKDVYRSIVKNGLRVDPNVSKQAHSYVERCGIEDAEDVMTTAEVKDLLDKLITGLEAGEAVHELLPTNLADAFLEGVEKGSA